MLFRQGGIPTALCKHAFRGTCTIANTKAGRIAVLSVSGSDRTTWTYDPADQLVGEHINGISEVRSTFVYDPAGNRLRRETLYDGITTSVYNAANELLTAQSFSGITTYSYDLSGNRRSVEDPTGDLTTYTFDALNHNIAVENPSGDVVTFTWAPVNKANDDRQIQRDDGTDVRRYVWDDQTILQETDDTGLVTATTTSQPGGYGQLISRTDDDGQSTYQFDALGNTTSLTDNTGTPTDDYRYEAFGKVISGTGSTNNPYTWIGQQGYRQESETGEYNLRARDYDPAAARFTSQDPLGLAAGDSNFYRYVSNDPINRNDPGGLLDLLINQPKVTLYVKGLDVYVQIWNVTWFQASVCQSFKIGTLVRNGAWSTDRSQWSIKLDEAGGGCIVPYTAVEQVLNDILKDEDYCKAPAAAVKSQVISRIRSNFCPAGPIDENGTAPCPSGAALINQGMKELGLDNKEDLMDADNPRVRQLIRETGECCKPIRSGGSTTQYCRIKVATPCGATVYLWVAISNSGLRTSLTIVGSDDGSKASFDQACTENRRIADRQAANDCMIPFLGSLYHYQYGDQGDLIYTAPSDALAALGAFGWASRLAKGAAGAGRVLQGGLAAATGTRAIVAILDGNYSSASVDIILAILHLRGAGITCRRGCASVKGLSRSCPASNGNPWAGLPLRSNSYGAAEKAAGSFVNRRLPLSAQTPDGIYKFVIDSSGKVWLAPVAEDVPHSALVPNGTAVYGAGYVAIKNGKANVNGRSGHFMADNPVGAASEQKYDCALRQTFAADGVTVIDNNVGLGGGLLRPPTN